MDSNLRWSRISGPAFGSEQGVAAILFLKGVRRALPLPATRPLAAKLGVALAAALPPLLGAQTALPDSPGALLLVNGTAAARQTTAPTHESHCPASSAAGSSASSRETCHSQNPVQSIVSHPVRPLTVRNKGLLAIRDVDDPFNLITIAGYSGFAIAANAHSAFGPGFAGWGRLTGYSLVEDAQGEFLGTFAIPSLVHEDPRYHRMPGAPVKKRLLHAFLHTYVSQHDDGRPMPNYATLINYPASAEIANLYVPGIQTDGKSTVRRFCIGLATDSSGTLVAEFLPDVARHIHIHIIFVQEIINQVVTGGTAPNVQ